MKIRRGFISNSSSSSFILLLKRKPKDVEDTLKLVYPMSFEEAIKYHIHYDYSEDTVLHAPEAAKLIYDQLKEHEESWGKKEKGGYKSPTKIQRIGSFVHRDYYYCDKSWRETPALESHIDEDDRHALVTASLDRNAKHEAEMYLFHKYRDKYEKQLKEGKPEKYTPDWNEVLTLMRSNKDYAEAEKAEKEASDTFEVLCNKVGEKIYRKWVKAGYWIGVVSFGDENGAIGAIMEHGNAFNSIKYVRISEH